MTASTLVSTFSDYFHVVVADSPSLRDEVYRIRYKVYCEEMRTERKEDFPEGKEFDPFDKAAVHCLLQHRPSGLYAGCVRLVLTDADQPSLLLPFERYCRESLRHAVIETVLPHRGYFGEISRLAVPANFKRRKGEQGMAAPLPLNEHPSSEAKRGRDRFPYLTAGLFLAAAAMGLVRGMSGVFAMMEPRLSRYLRQFGIEFEQVGEEVDYHGRRAAFYITKEGLKLNDDVEELLDFIMGEIKSQEFHNHEQQ